MLGQFECDQSLAVPAVSAAELEEAAGRGGGVSGGPMAIVQINVAVQDQLSLIVKHNSDEESDLDDEWDDQWSAAVQGAAISGLDLALHQPLDWEGLCAYERLFLQSQTSSMPKNVSASPRSLILYFFILILEIKPSM